MTTVLSSPLSPASRDLRETLRAAQPVLWINPLQRLEDPQPVEVGHALGTAARTISLADIQASQDRFDRFAPLLARLFPELAESNGRIESELLETPALAAAVGTGAAGGRMMVKQDHLLPVAGSIKARGGIHEVLEHAEALALRAGLIQPGDDYRLLAEPAARAFFARHSVAVGSTGNLGLSIGVIASALGFQASVHMSSDAKAWKKDRLRQRGVTVVEHEGDYAQAVAQGRAQAQADPLAHFVDDERSLSLLLGYAAAALGLRRQLAEQGVTVDARHPLFVYLPCGVGGAPAGIAFGIRQVLGPHAHCFFAEPTQSPCVLVQMMDGQDGAQGPHPSVYDYGLDNRTEADGLAVPQASLLASAVMRGILGGVFTVEDAMLLAHVYRLEQSTGLQVEPSATAGLSGPAWLLGDAAGQRYVDRHGLTGSMHRATHLVWTTGGLFVPPEQYRDFWQQGQALCNEARPSARTDALRYEAAMTTSTTLSSAIPAPALPELPPAARPGDALADIDTPALLLDLDAFERNLDLLQSRALAAGIALRPHAKAHKCPSVALAQIARGAVGVCCQKVSEALPFIEAGVHDIHISNEIAGPAKARLLAGLAHHAKLSVCADAAEQVGWLAEAAAAAGSTLTVMVEIDIGHGRCGVPDIESAVALARQIAAAQGLSFGGLQAYHGTVQHVRSPEERRQIIAAANARIRQTVAALEAAGLPCPTITGGGTGSAEVDFASGVYTELQAGSYAFMDVDYRLNGTSGAEGALQFEHSLFVATRVMSRAAPGHAVLDAGLKSMSLESGLPWVWEVEAGEAGQRSSRLLCSGVSDEHCTLEPAEDQTVAALPALGSLVCLVPGHVDPTFNLHDALIGVRRGQVESIWTIDARGLSR